ncbi:MAG: DUF3343 domain-containing protein [Bacteroidales bacterium]|nr:DUF3343 domain-containing protein [Bacteroidales bacterium]MBN2749170.1 DUF3343 domain-containing protein [Bacteroidales bacterium]
MTNLSNNGEKYLLLFQNIHKVMKAEQILKVNNVEYQVVPVPSAFSSECGMCIQVYGSLVDFSLELLHKNSIDFRLVING